jgi:hypothetical protein
MAKIAFITIILTVRKHNKFWEQLKALTTKTPSASRWSYKRLWDFP